MQATLERLAMRIEDVVYASNEQAATAAWPFFNPEEFYSFDETLIDDGAFKKFVSYNLITNFSFEETANILLERTVSVRLYRIHAEAALHR